MPKDDASAEIGEVLIAVVMAAVSSVLIAIAGFVLGIFPCTRLFVGEATESASIVAPATALLFGGATFAIVFRLMIHYGDSPSRTD